MKEVKTFYFDMNPLGMATLAPTSELAIKYTQQNVFKQIDQHGHDAVKKHCELLLKKLCDEREAMIKSDKDDHANDRVLKHLSDCLYVCVANSILNGADLSLRANFTASVSKKDPLEIVEEIYE